MWNSLGARLGLATLFMLGLITCGGNDDAVSPASLKSRLLPASALPGFKVERDFSWDNPIDFVGQDFPLPESTPPSEAVKAFEDAGFEAGVGTRFVVAKGDKFDAPGASVDVVQLGSDDQARDALDYVRKEAVKQPCFSVCSVNGREFAVRGIPGAKGMQLTPLPHPPPGAPPPFEAYGVVFTIGPQLFLTNSGGPAGQVEKGLVLRAAKALYDRSTNRDGSSAAAAGVEPLLLARGEEPGYQPVGPLMKDRLSGFVEKEGLSRAEARRLRDRGFVSITARPLQGKDGSVGVTSIVLFTNAAGAKSEAAEERRDLEDDFRGWKVKRFDVTGAPGAFGWTAKRPGQRVGNITWVEGRCVTTLGNADAKSLVAPLTAGMRAQHRRIEGRCPKA